VDWLSKNMINRSLWTGAQALAGLGLTYLAGIPAWWAAPVALLIAAVKTHVVDKRAAAGE
jgi:hypothetical protein